MKITLDLSKLVEEGRLTPADAERLKALAAHDTGNLGLTILTGFGVIAASVGAVAVMLTTSTSAPRRRRRSAASSSLSDCCSGSGAATSGASYRKP